MTGSLYMGVDIGASAAKAMLLCSDKTIVGAVAVPTGIDFSSAADRVISALHCNAGTHPAQVRRTVACGYGRRNVPGTDGIKTEIACHAKGAHHITQTATTVLDIGGQDNKVIRVTETGGVRNFNMNQRCASGTGAFLEEMARRMEIPLEEMAPLAERADFPAPISAFCTVFAGAEILAAARKGTPKEMIVLGVFAAMADRALSLSGVTGDITLTGGVAAHNPVFCRLIQNKLEGMLFIPSLSQYIGALGAALFAFEMGDTDQEKK